MPVHSATQMMPSRAVLSGQRATSIRAVRAPPRAAVQSVPEYSALAMMQLAVLYLVQNAPPSQPTVHHLWEKYAPVVTTRAP